MQNIRIFLSSPGDVKTERQSVNTVVAQLNRLLGDYLDIRLEIKDWKIDVAPDMGRAQEIINRQIGEYDIFVGIMWKRFGTPTGKAGSGTEEEFDLAFANWERFNKPRILFYFSQTPYFPKNSVEGTQLLQVLAFKEKLQEKGLIAEYEKPEDFADILHDHLGRVLREMFPQKGAAPEVADFTKYLTCLQEDTCHIDIRGLVTGEGKVHRFQIDQLYIPLKTSGAGLVTGKREGVELAPREVPLQTALKNSRLIIKGDPGAGKTTFLRLICFTLCQKWLGESPLAGTPRLTWPDPPPLPIFIRLGTLTGHIREWKQKDPANCPTQKDSPEWLLHFLSEQCREYHWPLTAEAFRCELAAGRCLILLDGLDEAPDPPTRKQMSNFAANLLKAFPDCQVVLTSRPAALVGAAAPLNFELAEIAALDNLAMETFLNQWTAALYPTAPEKSRAHQQELLEALQARPEIRRMARTPVMLTALAVVHWNENRLPEQRAELYESIITWLARARDQRTGRLKADRCRKLLQKLALAMFTHRNGRQREVTLHWAADKLVPEFAPTREKTPLEQAKQFLQEEMVDSGIIVERGRRLEFWHLSFQEYLAAFEIAGLLEKEQQTLLYKKERLFSSEWRETVLLLGGVLYKQGEEKINHLINAILQRGPAQVNHQNLPQLAKTVGVLGGLVRDLAPYDFKPANPAYEQVVQGVMGIFDRNQYRSIAVQVRIEAADTLGQVGDPRLAGNPMCKIPGGRFWMGAQKRDPNGQNYDPAANEGDFNESPVHQVELAPFFISQYPVTVGQFHNFMTDHGYEDPQFWLTGGFGRFSAPDEWEDQLVFPSRPVVNVSWYEAAAYAYWAGGRLPTEAEWERTARGPGNDYRKYPWGNSAPTGETTNFSKSKIGHVTSVGIFPAGRSNEDVSELAGNVWEWCGNWFSTAFYQKCRARGVVRNPSGPEEGDRRVVRGGSFYYILHNLRCADRSRSNPDYRDSYIGFRVVRRA